MKSPISKCPITLALIFCVCASAFAQDNHYTLYNHLPLSLNPGLTAMMAGEIRTGMIYRNQWRVVGKPFTTISAYADKKFVFKKFDLGAGLSVTNDRSGPGGLNVVEIYPSAALGLKFGKHALALGAQPGIVHKRLGSALFPNQFDPTTGTYTPTLPSGEPTDVYRVIYFDMSTGVVYKLHLKNGYLQIGESMHHLTAPNEALMPGTKDKLAMRYTTHGEYLHWFKTKTFLTASTAFMVHAKATELNLSTSAGYRIISEEKKNIMVRLGMAYRNNINTVSGRQIFNSSDAVSILSGFSWNEIDVDFAYDFNVSKLSENSKNAGAFEIAVTYKNAFERKNNTITVPCRRY